MKKSDIDRRYTKILADYLSQGYTVNTSTPAREGEIAKVDLVKEDDLIRLIMTERKLNGNALAPHGAIAIIVLGWPEGYSCNTPWRDVGNERCLVVSVANRHMRVKYYEIYYVIGFSRGKDSYTWYGTKEEMEKAEKKRAARMEWKKPSLHRFCSRRAVRTAWRIVRKTHPELRLKNSNSVLRKEGVRGYILETDRGQYQIGKAS